MNAGTAFRGVQTEAGLGGGVVGNLGPAVRLNRRIGVAGGDHLDAASGEERSQANGHGQGKGFFRLAAVQSSAGVVPPVGGIEDYNEPDRWAGRSGRGLLR